jgi:hypothetical protein
MNPEIRRGVGERVKLEEFGCELPSSPSVAASERNTAFPGVPIHGDFWVSSKEPFDNPGDGQKQRYLDICITYSEIGSSTQSTYHTKIQYHGESNETREPIMIDGIRYYRTEGLTLRQTIAE